MAGKRLNKIQIFTLLIGFFAIMLPLIIGHYKDYKFRKKLMEDSIIVSGNISGFDKTYKRADALKYDFEYNRKKYKKIGNSNGKSSDYEAIYKYVINRTFPVLINKINPQEYSKLLVVPEDFQEYGLPFPDSLKWILKYINR